MQEPQPHVQSQAGTGTVGEGLTATTMQRHLQKLSVTDCPLCWESYSPIQRVPRGITGAFKCIIGSIVAEDDLLEGTFL